MKIKIDNFLIKFLIFLIIIKLIFSYLNVELDWWQRHLTPNFEKYNFFGISEDFNKQIEFFIIPILIIYLFRNRNYIQEFTITLAFGGILILLNLCTALFTGKTIIESIDYSVKILSPIMLFISLIIHFKKHNYNLDKIHKLVLRVCFILTLVGLIFFDPSYNHDRNWLPIYFTSLHSHNYVLVSIAMGYSFILYTKRKYYYLCGFLIFFFLFMYFGYRVRSPIVFFIIFSMAITFLLNNFFKVLWIKVLAFVPIFVALFLAFSSSFDFNEFSSGRLSMYEAKYEMLKGYNLVEFMFGRGKGSDFIRTDQWWYAEKNSHNDYLTFAVENGLIYLFVFFGLIFSLMFVSGKYKFIYSSILLGYLVTSLLSNGICLRPIASYVLFIVLAAIYVNTYNKSKIIKYD